MEIFRDKASMRAWSRAQRRAGKTIGLVPTMGYLHDGHLSLVDAATERADVVVASIYVNPTQFGPNEDFDIYPRDESGDFEKLRSRGVVAVFCPPDLYVRDKAAPHETWVAVEETTTTLCGASRPGFFRGVTTIVSKLLNIVEPDIAVFGQKDYQQWRTITRMVRDLDMGVEIVGMPIVREPDGLAQSSRNVRLSPEHRQAALALSRSLAWAAEAVTGGELDARALVAEMSARISASGGVVDYVEVVDALTMKPVHDLRPLKGSLCVAAVAVGYGDVRLIDNRELSVPN